MVSPIDEGRIGTEAVCLVGGGEPKVGIVEEDGAAALEVGIAQERHDRTAVDGLKCVGALDTCHLEERREKVFDHDRVAIDIAAMRNARPRDDERFAYAAEKGRTFACSEGVVGLSLRIALAHVDALSAIVGHENNDGIACHFGALVEVVEEVAETFVHAFDEGSVVDFLWAEGGF